MIGAPHLAPREYTGGNHERRNGSTMANTLAIMMTMTTYGTWLRGDARGWVDKGVVFPPDPDLEATDCARLKHSIYRFADADGYRVGSMMGESLRSRQGLRIYAMTVQPWHTHFVVAATSHPIGQVAKCAKDAVRWGLRPGRPIWGDGYDKRFCYDARSVRVRVAYVERHNLQVGRPARPWAFIERWEPC